MEKVYGHGPLVGLMILGSDVSVLTDMGIGDAAPGLLDAALVGLLLLPVLLRLMGRSAWYLPDWLDRVLLT